MFKYKNDSFNRCTSSTLTVTTTASNNSATVTATGGQAPYTYLWSNGGTTATINNLAEGTFNVTVTDAAGCAKTGSVVVSNSSVTVTDIDGNVYQTVVIGTQTWTQTNLNVSKYRNGDTIPQVTNQSTWANLTTGAWCYYQNNTANGATYGKLYNWYAVNDPRGLAPAGYHIPSDAERITLTTFLGGESIAGGKMKSTTGWNSPNTAATNSSGFTGLPGGCRNDYGSFYFIGETGYWWSSSEDDATNAWNWGMSCNTGGVGGGAIIKKAVSQSVASRINVFFFSYLTKTVIKLFYFRKSFIILEDFLGNLIDILIFMKFQSKC
ncbi:FISUMP domain-containing protein [Flavobacterium sp.]